MRLPHQAAPMIRTLGTSGPISNSLAPSDCWSGQDCSGKRIAAKKTYASCCRGKDGGKSWSDENGNCINPKC
jgi:hypothetical protein